MTADLFERLRSLRPGEAVTLTDVSGARFSGLVVERRPGIDPADEVGLRRSNGTVHWIRHSRVRTLDAG